MPKMKTRKKERPKEDPDIFSGLQFFIHYENFGTGINLANAQVFSFQMIDDEEDPEDIESVALIVKRSFNLTGAKALVKALKEGIDAVDTIKKQFSKLDEINCYLDSMQSTVDDFRRDLIKDPDRITDSPDLDGDLTDLQDTLNNF